MAMFAVAPGAGPSTADLTGLGKGKSIASWHFSNITAAAVINLRDGSAAGTILIQIQLPIGASASQAYSQGNRPTFPSGVFVQVVTGTITGSIDLL